MPLTNTGCNGSHGRSGWRLLTITLLVTVLGAACSRVHHPSVSQIRPAPPAAGPAGDLRPPVDIDTPLVQGVSIPSVDEANSDAAFSVTAPNVEGTPVDILVSNPHYVARSDRAIAMVFHNAPHGTFDVVEEVSRASQADLASLAATCNPAKGCEGSWTMVTLNNGTPALLIQGPPGTTTGVIWIKGSVYFDVYGLAGSFSAQDSLAVANEMS